MRTLRGRFIFSHILPILVVVPLLGAGLIYLLDTQVLLSDLSDDVGERANIIAGAVNAQPDILQDPELAASFVNEFDLVVQGRIFLLDPEGELLATADPDLADQVGRPLVESLEGIEAAMAGEPSIIVYYSITRQRGEALVPVQDVNEELVGIVGVTETLTGVANQFGQLRGLVLLALALELVLALILALVLARRLARPIIAVTEAVTEIAGGERIEPVSEEGPVEIRQLAASVNILAARLHSLEESRRRLLANLVHELGRPLGAIRAAIHTLRLGAAENPAIRDELLAGVEDEVIRLQPLLDDLAQLHGQVLGTLELNRRPLDLSEWLPPVLLPWRAAALEKELEWGADIPADLPRLDLDPDRMGQVIGNLLSNAIKYSVTAGLVSVAAGTDGGQVWIRVSDNGPGIVFEEQERIFEPFFRSQQQRRFPQGLGLGLTIARDLVEAHGGWLDVESAPGQGSQFTVFLPMDDRDSG